MDVRSFRQIGLPRGSVALLFAILALSGCEQGGDSPPTSPDARDSNAPAELVPVSGVVLLDTKPLAGLLVQVAPQGRPVAQGYTNAQGRFALGTHAEADGCPRGLHPVAVMPCATRDDALPAIPEIYQDLKTTPLNVAIEGPRDDLRLEIPSGQP